MGSKSYILVSEIACKKYSFWRFLFDFFMVGITYGFWLIWLFIKYLRNGRL